MLPTVSGTCPTIETGRNTITLDGKSTSWTAWIGTDVPSGSGGPLLLYWRSGSADDVARVLGQAAVDDVLSMGGIVVMPTISSRVGTETGAGAWYTGDIPHADQFIACALEQHPIDPRRIHIAGFGYGAFTTVYMWYVRSGYVASAASVVGGTFLTWSLGVSLQDPSHLPAALAIRTAAIIAPPDLIITGTQTWENAITTRGGFVIDCNDVAMEGFNYVTALQPLYWQFLKDHPYGAAPYSSLGAAWPSTCVIQ
jgi:hypothetical protein